MAKEMPEDRGVLVVSASGNIYLNHQNPVFVQPLGPIQTVFTMEEENLLKIGSLTFLLPFENWKNYILKMGERLFGFTWYDLRLLAYQWAEKLRKSHTFNLKKNCR